MDLLQMFDFCEVFFVLDLKGKKTGEFRHFAGEQGVLSVGRLKKLFRYNRVSPIHPSDVRVY